MPVNIFLTASRTGPGWERPKANMAAAGDVQQWVDAVALHDDGLYSESIKTFTQFQPSAKIFFNIGFQYFIGEDVEHALMNFTEALNRDQYLAIGSFMLGNCHLKLKEYASAYSAFGKAHEMMRTSTVMDYKQLGMDHKLYLCDILLNKSLAAMQLGRIEKARNILLRALQCSVNGKTERIKFALESLQYSETFAPIIMPTHAIFRPVKQTVSSLEKKNYLGKSKVVSSISFSTKDEEARPKVSRREKLLTDIRKPEFKASLKRTKGRPEKSLPALPASVSSSAEIRPPRKALPPTPLVIPNRNSGERSISPSRPQAPSVPARRPRSPSPSRPPPMRRPPPRETKPLSPGSPNGSMFLEVEPKTPEDKLTINLNVVLQCSMQLDAATDLKSFRQSIKKALSSLPADKLSFKDINGNHPSSELLNSDNFSNWLENPSANGTHTLIIEN